MKRIYIVLFSLLFTIPFWSMSVFAASTQQQSSCLFFSETVEGDGGFSVCDDDNANFLAAFQNWGLQKIGYPISKRYVRDGFVTQAYQKAIMQWRPEGNFVVLVNIFDDLHNDGFDDQLLATRQTPKQFPPGWDGDITFTQVVEKRQTLLSERPALHTAYFSSSDPLTFYGLPTSEVINMGNHFAIRTQRAVLQEWTEDVPWAAKGQVTIANGGDIAKELDALPSEALVPENQNDVSGGEEPTTAPVPTSTAQPSTSTSNISGTILLTSNRSGSDECYTMNADGSNVKQLTTFGYCYDGHFSPDGSQIAFTHQEKEQNQFDIWIMNRDGSNPRNLTNSAEKDETFPVISPNGEKIAYLLTSDKGFELYTMNLDGSGQTLLTTGSFDLMQTWSPDSQKIAFSSARSGFFNIWTVNADGSDLKEVTEFDRTRAAIWPHFSPDSQELAFLTISQQSVWDIWQTKLDGTNTRTIAEAVVTDRLENPIFATWKQGYFLIGTGGNQGDWDPYFIKDTGDEVIRVIASPDNDTPTDWLP